MKQHTIANIADSEGVSKRTVQNWVKSATVEHGAIGTMVGNAWAFNDYEKSILLSYSGGGKVSARTTKQVSQIDETNYETTKPISPNYETVEVEIIDTQPVAPAPLAIIPTVYDISALRGGASTNIAPLAMANDALDKIAALRAAMQADMNRQEAQLNQQRLTVQMLDDETTKLQRAADEFRHDSKMNALREELLQAQQVNALGKLDAYAQSS
jgi:hypothetical protein